MLSFKSTYNVRSNWVCLSLFAKAHI